MANFSDSPALGSASSYSASWPSRNSPADDGSCSENVAVSVLTAHDIPIYGAVPPRGRLCGLDINNMAATDAVNLSVAENMKDGKFYEVYCNADGFAYFTEVYPNPPQVNLDIRTCIPTTSVDQAVDLVIVRGYDTPPVREFKDFESIEWLETDSLANYVTHCTDFKTEAWRAYKDPVLETQYKDGVENLYELQAFESLIGYVIDFDASTDINVKYSHSNTTIKNVPIDRGSAASFTGSLEVCNEGGLSTVSYTGFRQNLGNFEAIDKFGGPWPQFLGVQGVYAVAYEVTSIVSNPGATGAVQSSIHYNVKNKPKFVSLPASNWHWELDNAGGGVVFVYQPVVANDPLSNILDGFYDTASYSYEGDSTVREGHPNGTFLAHIGGAWLLLVQSLWAAVELDRPSWHVTDPSGNAVNLINALSIRYQPIVVTDIPAPVAYNMGSGSRLVDHTLDLYDSDPSTVQILPSSLTGSMAWLQTQTGGKTIDISLPFAAESDCLEIASAIYNAQNESVTSYNIVCGPESEPILGASVPGFEGRINRISESFQDSSSYTINVNVGPTFVGTRGWNTSIWQRKTENVSREGIVTWSSGDGVNYRVKLRGLGVYHAINKTLAAYSPGEKVTCTVYNNPVE